MEQGQIPKKDKTELYETKAMPQTLPKGTLVIAVCMAVAAFVVVLVFSVLSVQSAPFFFLWAWIAASAFRKYRKVGKNSDFLVLSCAIAACIASLCAVLLRIFW